VLVFVLVKMKGVLVIRAREDEIRDGEPGGCLIVLRIDNSYSFYEHEHEHESRGF